MNLILRSRLIQAVERVLHAPGNYTGGILEMTIVFDDAVEEEKLHQMSAEIAKTLKNHSEVFRNVRLNEVIWKSNEEIYTELVPMSMLMMGRYPVQQQEYCAENSDILLMDETKESMLEERGKPKEKLIFGTEKNVNKLLAYLKLFHARSKLILVLTDGEFYIEEMAVRESLKPFLERKLILLLSKAEARERLETKRIFRHVLEYIDTK